jgi:hypothetical protein
VFFWTNSPTDAHDEEEEIEYAADVWDAVPELVAARFVLAIRRYCAKPDLMNITRRLPACDKLVEGWFEDWKLRIDQLADFVDNMEAKDMTTSPIIAINGLKPGTLVFNDVLGVTALAAVHDNNKCQLLDLSRTDDENPKRALRIFLSDQVKSLSLPPGLKQCAWRTPEWLD